MTRRIVAWSVIVVALFGWDVATAVAQNTHMTRGTITSIGTDSITMRAGARDMVFAVDTHTVVEAVGAGTKTRAAQNAGRPGPQVGELLRMGQSVEITYADQSGQFRAARIRAIARLTEGEGDEHSAGRVTAVSATSLAIKGTMGNASFTQTFTIDPRTKVIGKGLGTMAATNGGRITITDAVAVGDTVGVWFHKGDADMLHASEIRVTKPHASSSPSSK